MRKMVRKRQEIPSIQSLGMGCAHVSCLWYNVSTGMTQFGCMDQNRISLSKCCAGTVNFSGTQLKYDLRDRKEAHARAVPSQHPAEIEDCECHEMLLALTTCCWPLMEGKGWRVVNGEVGLSPELQLQSRLLLFSLVNSWLCNIQIMQPAAL